MKNIVIIGAGQSGAQTLISLRLLGFQGQIHLIGEEPHLPYQRPPLSKKYLLGETKKEGLYLRGQAFYQAQNIHLHLNQKATYIDRANKTIALDKGLPLPFDKLVLATGGRAILWPQIKNAKNVFAVRTIQDIHNMRPYVKAGAKGLVIGGGYIGLESASVLRQLGCEVLLVEAQSRLLKRVATKPLADFFLNHHQEKGVDIKLGQMVKHFYGDDVIQKIQLQDGTEEKIDFVILGIGMTPNIELAQMAGISCTKEGLKGILVNQYGQTSDPDIYAAGDNNIHQNPLLNKTLRLESVQNAIDQAKIVASHILGHKKPYATIPWFWSDQYDVKLQMAGLATSQTSQAPQTPQTSKTSQTPQTSPSPQTLQTAQSSKSSQSSQSSYHDMAMYDDMVIRGDKTTNSFALFYYQGTKLIACEAINRPAEFMAAKHLILKAAKGAKIDPLKLGDETIKPKELLSLI